MTAITCGEDSRAWAIRVALCVASRARRWRVLRPRCASQQSNAEGTAPMAFWRKVRRSFRESSLNAATPMRTSWFLVLVVGFGVNGRLMTYRVPIDVLCH